MYIGINDTSNINHVSNNINNLRIDNTNDQHLHSNIHVNSPLFHNQNIPFNSAFVNSNNFQQFNNNTNSGNLF